jgi:thiol-disulfide isomerase/thioredoxin
MKDAESVAKEIGADLNPPKSTEQPVEDSKVLSEFVLPIKELTEENMVPQKTTLLLLYTHTCPHCITMKPIYEKIAPLLLQQGIQVCAINVARQRKAAIEYQVKGVPSLRFIHQSVKHEFKGQRTEPQILEWIYSIVPKSA